MTLGSIIWGACFERHWQNERRHLRHLEMFTASKVGRWKSSSIEHMLQPVPLPLSPFHHLFDSSNAENHNSFISMSNQECFFTVSLMCFNIFTVMSCLFGSNLWNLHLSPLARAAVLGLKAVSCLECHGTGTALGDPIEAGSCGWCWKLVVGMNMDERLLHAYHMLPWLGGADSYIISTDIWTYLNRIMIGLIQQILKKLYQIGGLAPGKSVDPTDCSR